MTHLAFTVETHRNATELDGSAVTCWCVEGRYAGPGRSHTFAQRSLGREFDLYLSGQVLLF
jgi:hypothetical protein